MHSDALTNSNSDKFGSDRLSIPKSNHQTHMDAFKDVDYEMIDEICKQLKFFKYFDVRTRYRLYNEFGYEIIPQNQVVFYETAKVTDLQKKQTTINNRVPNMPIHTKDSYSDKIFIVINGHASLYVEEKSENLKYITRTLFPGDAVGEGPLVVDMKPGQEFSLITQTECDIISINKEKFQEILIEDFTMISDLKDKMAALKKQIIFTGVTNYALMLLSNYIEIKTFQYGDTILSQGEKPEFFYIMIEGECKTTYETLILQDKKKFEKQRPKKGSFKDQHEQKTQIEENERKFRTGLVDYKKICKTKNFVKQGTNWKIAPAAFLGKYKDNKHKLGQSKVINLGKDVVRQLTKSSTQVGLRVVSKEDTKSPDRSQSETLLSKNINSIVASNQGGTPQLAINKLQSSNNQQLLRTQTRLILNAHDGYAQSSNKHPKRLGKPPLARNVHQRPAKDMVAIRREIEYIDGRVIISAEGDGSTFDDFDWGEDMTNISGLGCSFCHRCLLQDEPLRKQIHKHFDFYLKIVGGQEKINQMLHEQEVQKLAEKEQLRQQQIQRDRMQGISRPTKTKQEDTKPQNLWSSTSSSCQSSASCGSFKNQNKTSLELSNSSMSSGLGKDLVKGQTIDPKKRRPLLARLPDSEGVRLAKTSTFVGESFGSGLHESKMKQSTIKQANSRDTFKDLGSPATSTSFDSLKMLQRSASEHKTRKRVKFSEYKATAKPAEQKKVASFGFGYKLTKVPSSESANVGDDVRQDESKLKRARVIRNRVKPLASEVMQAKCEEGPISVLRSLAPESISGKDETTLVRKRSNSYGQVTEIFTPAFQKQLQSLNARFAASSKRPPPNQIQNTSLIAGQPQVSEIKKAQTIGAPMRILAGSPNLAVKAASAAQKLRSEQISKQSEEELREERNPTQSRQRLTESGKSKSKLFRIQEQQLSRESSHDFSREGANKELELFDFRYSNRTESSRNTDRGVRALQADLLPTLTRQSSVLARPKSFMSNFKEQNELLHQMSLAKIDAEALDDETKEKKMTDANRLFQNKQRDIEQVEYERLKEKQEKQVSVIQDLLTRSQLTVVANSSKVRVICMPRDAPDNLSEPVRRQIRQKILNLVIPMPKNSGQSQDEKMQVLSPADFEKKTETYKNLDINPHRYNFCDLVDRPFCTEEDLQNFITSHQEWIKIKDNIERYIY